MSYGHSNNSRESDHRAVIVDERPEWLDAAERVLTDLGVEVVAKETSAGAALSRIEREGSDLLVVHLHEESPAGLDCLRLARARRVPGLKAIAFGDSPEQSRIDAAFAAGAAAYVVKTAAREDIASAIRQAFVQSVHFGYAPGRDAARSTGGTEEES